MQLAVELQIVGRVGEDEIDRFCRQPLERGDAIALEDGIEPIWARGYGKLVGDSMADMKVPETRVTVYWALWLPIGVKIR